MSLILPLWHNIIQFQTKKGSSLYILLNNVSRSVLAEIKEYTFIFQKLYEHKKAIKFYGHKYFSLYISGRTSYLAKCAGYVGCALMQVFSLCQSNDGTSLKTWIRCTCNLDCKYKRPATTVRWKLKKQHLDATTHRPFRDEYKQTSSTLWRCRKSWITSIYGFK